MKLLHIDSGILGEHSISRRLSAALVAQWKSDVPGLEVTYRDLVAAPLDHLTGAVVASGFADGADALDEFLAADVVVIGAPMYNFAIPTQLKAWFDRLAVKDKTFRYTDKGVVGLAAGKTVIVVSTRGGFYGEGTALAALDHQETYLKTILSFMGITDIRFLRAEGVAISPDHKQTAIDAAEQEIATSATLFRQAA